MSLLFQHCLFHVSHFKTSCRTLTPVDAPSSKWGSHLVPHQTHIKEGRAVQLSIVFGNLSVSLHRPGNKRSRRDGAEWRHFISFHCISSLCLFKNSLDRWSWVCLQFRYYSVWQQRLDELAFVFLFFSFRSSFCLKLPGLNCIYLNTSGAADLWSVIIVFRQHQKHHTAVPRCSMFLTASKKRATAASAHCSCTNATPKTSTRLSRGLPIGFL